MLISEKSLKWVIRFYPPLFFQRIQVTAFSLGFRGVNVRIKKSRFNKNYNGSIFGGTLFSAADPFYPLLFHQIFKRKGYKVIVWLKSAQVSYLKPAATDMFFSINIDDDTISAAEAALNKDEGKYTQIFPIEILNKQSELCVLVNAEVYVRNL